MIDAVDVADVEQLKEPLLDRRTLLRAGAAGAAGLAVGVDGAANQTPLSPVGRSQAIGVTSAIIIGGAAAAAGVAIAKWRSDTDSPDTSAGDDALRDSLYSAGVSVAEGRSVFENEMEEQYLNRPSGQSPYANAAWSEIRAAAAKEIVNGNSQSDAEVAAQSALQAQTRIAVYNVLQRWNTGISALVPHVVAQDANGNVNVIKIYRHGDGQTKTMSTTTVNDSDVEPISETDTGSEYLAHRYTGSDLPGSLSDVESIDSEPTIPSFIAPNNMYGPVLGHWGIPSGGATLDSSTTYEKGNIRIEHPSFSAQRILDGQLYSDILSTIYTEYDSISSNLNTYVSNLTDALNQGSIDASDIYSPRDLVEQFASDDKRGRVAAELAAMGANVPADVSWEAQISHPDLQAEELWVDLYPQFTSNSIDIKPGITISSSDYSVAYIGYTSAANGEYQTDVLSGEFDLQILDIAGVDGSSDATDSAADTADSSGAINLGSDPVDQIKNPADYEDSFNLAIETADNGTYTVPVSDVQRPNDDYVISDSDSPLSGDEQLEAVRVVPTVETIRTSTYVADPTSVDSQQIKDSLQAQKDMVDKIEQLVEDESGDAVGILGGGLWDWFPASAEIQWAEQNVPGGTETVAAGGGLALWSYLS